ncbi:hypothetical protein [Siccibacter colletis]|uniref:hypothetical protein n=1 Tax=Siccibacter colletis TaxID=1505757 RepID=UPI003CF28619
MATIRQLPSGKWQVQIRVKGQKPVSSTHLTRAAAEQWANEYEQSATMKVSITIAYLTDSYLKEIMIKAGKRRGGYEATMYRLNNLANGLPMPLEQITVPDVIAYRNERLEQAQSGTVRLEIQLLSRFLRWAADDKQVPCIDVAKMVKLPEPGKARSKVIEPGELEMILSYAS